MVDGIDVESSLLLIGLLEIFLKIFDFLTIYESFAKNKIHTNEYINVFTFRIRVGAG